MTAAALTNAELATISNALKALSSNGKPEVGLEVGADQGLPWNAYIRIPSSLKRRTIARVTAAEYPNWQAAEAAAGRPVPPDATPYEPGDQDDYASVRGRAGWIDVTEYLRINGTAVASSYEVDALISETVTLDGIRDFIAANWDHVNSPPVKDEHRLMVIAVRFWAVVCGLVCEWHNKEYVEITGAIDRTVVSDMDSAIRFVAGEQQRALLFCAARAYNWKKTNHATGGTVAAGFVRKVMGDLWVTTGDARAKDKANASITDAFYSATHAVSVHAALATFAPEGAGHWARYNVTYGAMFAALAGPSIAMRMTGRDAVAGTAQVADPVKVFCLLLSEQLTPFLANRGQIPALLAAYDGVLKSSMEYHVGAKWFFSGHPNTAVTAMFNQKDEAWFQLAAELAVISQKYYPGHTIAASPALKTLATQCADASVDTMWGRLYAERKSAAVDQVIAAIRTIQGASAAQAIADITANEESTVRAGVEAFNQTLGADLAALQAIARTAVGSIKRVDVDEAVNRARTRAGSAWVAEP